MFGDRIKYAFLLVAVFAMIGYSGCILSPDEEPPPPKPESKYLPLTAKENVLLNLVQCYTDHNIVRYDELLHPDFIWYNQEGLTPQFFDRATDVDKTGKMFLAAENKYSDPLLWIELLTLKIYPGTWLQITEFEQAPCEDCWETTRTYEISARMNGGEKTYVGYDEVRFILVSVDKGGQRIYQIRRADDIKRPV